MWAESDDRASPQEPAIAGVSGWLSFGTLRGRHPATPATQPPRADTAAPLKSPPPTLCSKTHVMKLRPWSLALMVPEMWKALLRTGDRGALVVDTPGIGELDSGVAQVPHHGLVDQVLAFVG